MILLIATTDMVVSQHFCNDFMVSASLYQEVESCCEEGSCCHNETENHKLEQMFQISNYVPLPAISQFDLMGILSENSNDLMVTFIVKQNFTSRKPPSPPDIKTYLSLNQAFLL